MEVTLLAKQVSGLFDSTAQDERVYTDADLSRAFRAISGSGVSALDNNLRVETAQDGLKTRVRYGAAMCRGYYFELIDDGGGAFALAHAAALSMPRIDRVVLRLNLDSQARTVSLAVKQGNPAQTPEPPALTRTAMVWELSLARVTVATGAGVLSDADIVDERADTTVCGVLGSARVDQVVAMLNAASLPTATPGQTVQQALDGKLPSANLANNLTTSVAGSALDARQGPALSAAIAGAANTGILDRPSVYTHTLGSGSWGGSAAPFAQGVAQAAALTSGYLYLCYPHPDHYAAFVNAGVVMGNIVANGTVPFSAQKKPPSNITVYIVRWPRG